MKKKVDGKSKNVRVPGFGMPPESTSLNTYIAST